ncbi:MAG: cyclodeaminase/cyclohydrolase family protein [Acidobacteriota bacterium]|nr:cyclodeaminase/cyclohydrolase family protein [Acidobacteriota bacterium]
MTRFADLTVSGLLAALASPDPTPGGGTASAIAGAMGASLLVMVSGLAQSKTNTADEKAALEAARHALEPLRAELMRLADADSDAFDQVMAAYRRPKTTDEEKAARSSAIQAALRQATVVPLETLRACAAAMPLAAQVAEAGNRSAASDVGVAVGLLDAAAAGAEANVRINLDGLKDEGFNANVSSEASRLAAETAAAARAARQALAGR